MFGLRVKKINFFAFEEKNHEEFIDVEEDVVVFLWFQ